MNRFFPRRAGITAALLLALTLLISACAADSETLPSTTPASAESNAPVTVTTTSIPEAPVTNNSTGTNVTSAPITPPDTPPAESESAITEPITSEPVTSKPVVTDPPVTTTVPPVTTTTAPVTTADPPETKPPETDPPETEPAPPAEPSPYDELSRDAQYVLVYDLTANKTLYSTGDAQQIYPASTTKLLTLLYALTIVDEDTIFTVGSEINLAPWDSSKANIRVGEKYTCEDIVAALLLPSGNDAAYTLAATCGRVLAEDDSLKAADAIARFMEGLNAYAASLGLSGTHFVTPDGYHDPAHVTTMGDILLIARLAKAHPLLSRIMATATYKVTDIGGTHTQVWKNSNFLLQQDSEFYYPYATGCKTGFHTPAGACLIATAEKDGRELMVLIFKCSNKNVRFTDAKNFLELGFSLQGD